MALPVCVFAGRDVIVTHLFSRVLVRVLFSSLEKERTKSVVVVVLDEDVL